VVWAPLLAVRVEHRQELVGADATSGAKSLRFWVRLGQHFGKTLRAVAAHATRRKPSICLNQPSSWFQLAKFRLTNLRSRIPFIARATVGFAEGAEA
jgi:hypothetical protein